MAGRACSLVSVLDPSPAPHVRASVLLLCIRGVIVFPYLSGTLWVLLVEVRSSGSTVDDKRPRTR